MGADRISPAPLPQLTFQSHHGYGRDLKVDPESVSPGWGSRPLHSRTPLTPHTSTLSATPSSAFTTISSAPTLAPSHAPALISKDALPTLKVTTDQVNGLSAQEAQQMLSNGTALKAKRRHVFSTILNDWLLDHNILISHGELTTHWIHRVQL